MMSCVASGLTKPKAQPRLCLATFVTPAEMTGYLLMCKLAEGTEAKPVARTCPHLHRQSQSKTLSLLGHDTGLSKTSSGAWAEQLSHGRSKAPAWPAGSFPHPQTSKLSATY